MRSKTSTVKGSSKVSSKAAIVVEKKEEPKEKVPNKKAAEIEKDSI